ncbi:D-3-phosphoglycerate dehydrogenase [Tenacibaculum lutimaris]|uniref:D-3-phosphoglycerate dehydrogenase n=1 Tax=Tenacibaculum lutimaris TaxID=285258 RepID=A0A420E1R1_9FLAO|nr:D-2-hydroxyacid dehydrogenase [Tenacibaculum lutimaris]RKF03833.1 D-3-phosphoglycerate dehydrogenase [Tenacibaculum lutimaris]
MKILVTDGISASGIQTLEDKGFEVINTKVAQKQLENYINDHTIDAITVGNTTQVRQELIDACPSIKLIACLGTEMDNIDVDYAIDNGVHVVNSEDASATSIAELVFAHLFGMVRFLHQSNREMPLEGDLSFNLLKRQFSQGIELRGKTLGIVGFGHIGQEVAKMALGLGMKIVATDTEVENATITISFFDGQSVNFSVKTQSLNDVLSKSDFVTLHLPAQEEYVIEAAQLDKMKDGVGIINTSRGSVLNEVDLVNAIESGKVKYAGLDVFENQPTPEIQLLMNPEISMTPHIGASTIEAQERIGVELANKIIKLLSE